MNTLTEHLSHRPMRSGVRASLVVVLAILALAAASLVVAPIASAVEDVQPARAEGPTRLETAVAVADRAHPEGSDEVVVGPSDDFTHTLAGAARRARVYKNKWFSDHAPLIMDYEFD